MTDQGLTPSDGSQQVPLAIVGVSCLFPRADGPENFWANIRDGVDTIGEIPPTHWNVDDYFNGDPQRPDMTYARRGGFLSPVAFDPLEFGISPNNLEAIDTSQLLGLVAAKRALESAGYGADREFDRTRVGCILGVTGTLEMVIPLGARLGHPIWRRALAEAGVADDVAQDVIERISAGYVPWQENSFPGLLGNVVAGRIANRLNLGGTNCVVDAACASSLSALHLASLELAAGRSDMVLAGGVDTFNDIFMYMCFSKTPALSPTGDARPFADDADGTILGEGVGMLVLKRLDDARHDGDRIVAVLRGIGTSSDGEGNAVYAPDADGQRRCLENAYRVAGVAPETVELVEAHGTGTKVGDATEAAGLSRVFGDGGRARPWCALGSVKSQIGHTKAAAGVAGVIKAALALYHRVLPPTIKVRRPADSMNAGDSPFYLSTEARPWCTSRATPRRAGVSAFGFGGSNFHCVLEEAPDTPREPDWGGDVELVSFSATSRVALFKQLEEWGVPETREQLRVKAAQSRRGFRREDDCRLQLVVEWERTDLGRLIASARAMLEKYPEKTAWSTPDGAHFGSGAPVGTLGIVFPGQGAQYVGMLRDLVCRFPQMQTVLEQANAVFTALCADEGGDSPLLTDSIYPVPSFSEATRDEQERRLRGTEIAQPAIGAVSLAAWTLLEEFGVRASAVAGHSYGELTALCASHRFEPAVLYRLSKLRGRLMAETNGDDGGMLAVSASDAVVQSALAEEAFDLVVANRNSPNQVVLSGRVAEIDRAVDAFARRDVRGKRLAVSAAFHSPLVASASERFRPVLDEVEFAASSVPVFANTSAEPYPDDPGAARDVLAGQLARPVEWVTEIENMYEAGVRTFLEVGPGCALSGLVGSILGDRSHAAFSLDASAGARSGMVDLAHMLAQLSVLGHEVRLELWDPVEMKDDEQPAGLTIPICGANYVKPREPRPPRARTAAPSQTAQADSARPAAVERNGGHRPEPPSFASQSPVIEAPQPAATPARPRVASTNLNGAFEAAQQNLLALQAMQRQTAELHRDFLQGQEAALKTFQTLAEQQQALLTGGPAPQITPDTVSESGLLKAETPVVSPAQSSAPAAARQASPPHPETDGQKLSGILLEVVSEKTGYPAEMLNLEMGLDKDLGIDSIKRVEILSALQERLPDLPAVKPEQLGALHQLKDVVALLKESYSSTPQPVAGAPAALAPRVDGLETILLEVVAEKTGYPAEMLTLEMGLDKDLGIDSIKRVEILSALQEQLPELPAVQPEQLGTLNTLRDVAALLSNSAAGVAPPPPTPDAGDLASILLQVVAEKTGYSAEMLNLDMGLDKDLGVDSIKRVEILSALQERVPDAPSVQPEQLGSLQTLRHALELLAAPPDSKPTLAAAVEASAAPSEKAAPEEATLTRSVVKTIELAGQDKPVHIAAGAEFWISDAGAFSQQVADQLQERGYRPRLIGRDVPAPPERLGGLLLLPPADGADDSALKHAFQVLQHAGPALKVAAEAGGAVLVTVARLDGAFGFGDGPLADPLSGGLSALAKTVRHEWPSVQVKAIDLSEWDAADRGAAALVNEALQCGPIEVGLTPGGRCGLKVVEGGLSGAEEPPIEPGDLVVVTGGARGVTAAAAVQLAARFQPTIALLGRSPEPQSEPDWLAPLGSEREIKQALFARAGAGASPAEIEPICRQLLANREVLRNLERLRATGVRVEYRSVDVRDARAVGAALTSLQEAYGPLRGLIHGAGVLADQRIEDKTPEQFAKVYETKVAGMRHLLDGLDAEQLRFLAAFSSFTARFGRTGQVDYAVANEALNKLAQQFQRTHPACRVVSFNWGPWDGGMVNDGLRKLFASEGVGLIPLEAGADLLVREIAQAAKDAVEVIVVARGKTDPATEGTRSIPEESVEPSAVVPADHKLAFERVLDLSSHPFLRSHVIGGKAVLPMAVILEWLAQGALHANPGLQLEGVDELRVFKGVRIEDPAAGYPVRVLTGRAAKRDGAFHVPVKLVGASANSDVMHAAANVVLANARTSPPQPRLAPEIGEFAQPFEAVYDSMLFHGRDFHGIKDVVGCAAQGIVGIVRPAPAPAEWIREPQRGDWITDPLVIDCCFQLMILWSLAQRQAASLPCFAGRYRQYCRKFPSDGVRVTAQVTRQAEHQAFADVEIVDSHGNLVAELRDYECVIDPALADAFRRNQVD